MNDKEIEYYKKNGFIIIDIFSKKNINDFKTDISKRVNQLSSNYFGKNFNIINYHILEYKKNLHHKIVGQNKRHIKITKEIKKKINNNNTINKILNSYWNHNNYKLLMMGNRRNKGKKDPFLLDKVSYRIARPDNFSKNDVGGFHYDLKYGGSKNTNQNAFASLWVPICGFSNKYSLKICPGSHLVNHKESNISKQSKFTSAVFKDSYTKKFKSFRPNLKKGQGIFFHPNLLHGGSINLGKFSRISLEFRLCNKKEFEIKFN